MEKSIQKPESVQDQPDFCTNFNNPGQVSSYPAIHLSRYEMGYTGSLSNSPYIWCNINGIQTGCAR